MFNITRGKGFHVLFPNGYTVSVQFGPGNYCQNRSAPFNADKECGEMGSKDAECAVWKDFGDYVRPEGWNDDVKGWMSPTEVLELFQWAASQPE